MRCEICRKNFTPTDINRLQGQWILCQDCVDEHFTIPAGNFNIESSKPTLTICDKDFSDAPSLEWLVDAVKEKLKRETLDENSLVRCGCGGKAEFGDGCKVVCSKCGIATLEHFTQDDAKVEWNRAIGG